MKLPVLLNIGNKKILTSANMKMIHNHFLVGCACLRLIIRLHHFYVDLLKFLANPLGALYHGRRFISFASCNLAGSNTFGLLVFPRDY